MIVIGNLGQDAIIKDVNGKKVREYSVAHTETFTKDGNKIQKTTWVSCSQWSEKTAVADYLKKGTQVYVEGTPSVDAWTNKEGAAQATLRLRVDKVQLLGGRQEGARNAPAATDENANLNSKFDIPDTQGLEF